MQNASSWKVSLSQQRTSYVWGRGGAILIISHTGNQFPTRQSNQQTVDKIKKVNYIKGNSASHVVELLRRSIVGPLPFTDRPILHPQSFRMLQGKTY